MIFSASKTPGSIVAEILMLKTTHNGGFLLVEGDDDSLFWSSRTIRNSCQIVIAGGKPNVIDSALLLDQRSDRTVLGYIDCDFDRVKGLPIGSKRLSRTDTHDLETMILSCTALDKVLAEIADLQKLAVFEAQTQSSVLQAVIDRALPFGRLRLLNDLRNYQVNFHNLSPYKFFDFPTWKLDLAKLESEFCQTAGIQPYILPAALASIPQAAVLDMIQGHDALSILAIGLKGPLGRGKNCSEKDIASRLRSSVESQHLAATKLYTDLTTYEAQLGLRVFAL